MKLITTTTVGSGGATSVTFTGIPATYTDLVVLGQLRHNYNGNELVCLRLNGDTSSSYSGKKIAASDYAAVDNSDNGSITDGFYFARVGGTNLTSNTFGNFRLLIANYTGSQQKTIVAEDGVETNSNVGPDTGMAAGRWTGTAAVNSLTIYGYFGRTFVENSIISLYGITKGSGGATVS